MKEKQRICCESIAHVYYLSVVKIVSMVMINSRLNVVWYDLCTDGCGESSV